MIRVARCASVLFCRSEAGDLRQRLSQIRSILLTGLRLFFQPNELRHQQSSLKLCEPKVKAARPVAEVVTRGVASTAVVMECEAPLDESGIIRQQGAPLTRVQVL